MAPADNDLTASGVTLGTFDYISPEQARDPRSADVRSDLYSLGCSFFYMLTGRPPFPDGTVLQKLLQHQGDHPPDPRSLRPELPPEVTWILARLLAKSPAQRFQQPSELTSQLADLGEKLGVHLSSSSSRTVLPRPRVSGPWSRLQHHLPWAVPVAVLLLVVFAIDYFDTSRLASDPPVAIVPIERAADAAKSPAPSAATNPTQPSAAVVAPTVPPITEAADTSAPTSVSASGRHRRCARNRRGAIRGRAKRSGCIGKCSAPAFGESETSGTFGRRLFGRAMRHASVPRPMATPA